MTVGENATSFQLSKYDGKYIKVLSQDGNNLKHFSTAG